MFIVSHWGKRENVFFSKLYSLIFRLRSRKPWWGINYLYLKIIFTLCFSVCEYYLHLISCYLIPINWFESKSISPASVYEWGYWRDTLDLVCKWIVFSISHWREDVFVGLIKFYFSFGRKPSINEVRCRIGYINEEILNSCEGLSVINVNINLVHSYIGKCRRVYLYLVWIDKLYQRGG